MKLLVPATFVALGFLTVACPKGARLENSDEFECEVADVFEASCDGARCHEGTVDKPPNGGLDLFLPGRDARVLNSFGVYEGIKETATCPPKPAEPIIDLIDIDQSLMMKKILGTHMCGEQMPPAGQRLEEAEVACVRRWIESLDPSLVGNTGGAGGAAGSSGAAGKSGETL